MFVSSIMDEISLYDAIRQMRELSSQGKSFSFVHSTYNQDTDKTNGIRLVNKAHLRPAARGDELSQADFKLFYFDEDLQEPRNCWQMLILEFNGKHCIIN